MEIIASYFIKKSNLSVCKGKYGYIIFNKKTVVEWFINSKSLITYLNANSIDIKIINNIKNFIDQDSRKEK